MKYLLSMALVGIFGAVEVQACGDSLYRVGRGVAYRTYSAPLPGNLLVHVHSAETEALATAMAESGHSVRIVADLDELRSELNRGGYDVVVTSLDDSFTATQGLGAVFVPFAATSAEAKSVKRQFKRVLVATDDLPRHLLTIHRVLKSRA